MEPIEAKDIEMKPTQPTPQNIPSVPSAVSPPVVPSVPSVSVRTEHPETKETDVQHQGSAAPAPEPVQKPHVPRPLPQPRHLVKQDTAAPSQNGTPNLAAKLPDQIDQKKDEKAEPAEPKEERQQKQEREERQEERVDEEEVDYDDSNDTNDENDDEDDQPEKLEEEEDEGKAKDEKDEKDEKVDVSEGETKGSRTSKQDIQPDVENKTQARCGKKVLTFFEYTTDQYCIICTMFIDVHLIPCPWSAGSISHPRRSWACAGSGTGWTHALHIFIPA